MSNTYYGTRQGRVHYGDEHMNTLACDGHNGGGESSYCRTHAPVK